MRAVYCNRLMRNFFGRREQNPFTDFDLPGNTPLSGLLDNGNACSQVINMTLSITAGKNIVWGERQAAAFTATPLACGLVELRHPEQHGSEIEPPRLRTDQPLRRP
jgi:hypothetical protein